jgi:hypothetical protein
MHRFWSSHEDKQDCVRLSMGGKPWPCSRCINGGMASSLERNEREGEGEQGARLGGSMGLAMGRQGLQEGGHAVALSVLPRWLLYVRRRKEEGEREEKRKGRKRKEKNEKMKKISNLKIFREKNKR